MQINKQGNTENQAVEIVRSWLDKEIRITLKSKRTITGTFFCFDKQQNILLNHAYEDVKSPDSDSSTYKKELGVAMVPMHHIESCKIRKSNLINNINKNNIINNNNNNNNNKNNNDNNNNIPTNENSNNI